MVRLIVLFLTYFPSPFLITKETKIFYIFNFIHKKKPVINLKQQEYIIIKKI